MSPLRDYSRAVEMGLLPVWLQVEGHIKVGGDAPPD